MRTFLMLTKLLMKSGDIMAIFFSVIALLFLILMLISDGDTKMDFGFASIFLLIISVSL